VEDKLPIAGMDLSVEGADVLIFVFSLWGSTQILYTFMQLLSIFSYKTLIPLMYVLIILEILIGKTKQVLFLHIPPAGRDWGLYRFTDCDCQAISSD